MTWPRDDAKLERVRALMREHGLDALVVRAPDNVLYLTNFWGMKGFDAAVFPRESEPVLITIEPSAQDAADMAWTKESEAAALWQGFVHGEGTGWKGKVELALPFSLVWSGPGIRTFTATGHRPVSETEPTLFEIWVCADGYWCDHTKNVCPGELTGPYERLLEQLLEVYAAAVDHCRPGASLAELDRLIRAGIAEAG